MKNLGGELAASALLIMLITFPTRNVLASVDIDVRLEFLDEQVAGSCEILITDDEEYRTVDAGCTMEKSMEVVSHIPIVNYDMGWPRSPVIPAYFTWPTLALFPQPNRQYCQFFGDDHLDIIFGHISDSQLNLTVTDVFICDVLEEPIYRAYFSTGCFDAFTYFWNYLQLTLSGATFYVVIGEPGCISVAPPQEWEVTW